MSESTVARITVGAKPFWASWTLWFNLLSLLALLGDWAIATEFEFVTTEWFVLMMAIVNTLLRIRTKRPVSTEDKLVTINKYG